MSVFNVQSDTERFPFTVKLSFYEARTKQGIVRPYQEKVFWEVWRVHLRLVQASQSQAGVMRLSLHTCQVQQRKLVHYSTLFEAVPGDAAGSSPFWHPAFC
jgi:hypothetical protein